MPETKKTSKKGYNWMGGLTLIAIIAVGILVGKIITDRYSTMNMGI